MTQPMTPDNLREVADMLDILDETLRTLIPFSPASDSTKADALAVVTDSEMQQDIRRWADELEKGYLAP